jgi:hypothetical protein
MSTEGDGRPLLRVVRGEPTDAELAALTTAVLALVPDSTAPAPPPAGRWNDPAARMRRELHPGPGAWRASAWPR